MINISSNHLQEAQLAPSEGNFINMPQFVVDGSGATSSVTGKVLIANDSLLSRRNSPVVGLGFYCTVSSDISGEIIGNNSRCDR